MLYEVITVESNADEYAQTRFEAMNLKVDEFEKIHITDSLTKRYLDSVSNKVVYSLFKKYTYMDCKERDRITSYNVCYTKLLRTACNCL